jgi:type I restriction enzyme M protein
MFYNTGIGTYIWIVTNRKEKRRRGKIQLLDGREFWVPLRRSLGDKRRKIGEAKESEPDQIGDLVRLYGRFQEGEHSKILDNEDVGYTRVTVERPLRLRYQMDTERKSRFLDACPHLLDDVQAIDKTLGRQPQLDWNDVWRGIQAVLVERDSKWRAVEQKLFRDVLTDKNPAGEPVLRDRSVTGKPTSKKARMSDEPVSDSEYEPDPGLRDFENVPLKEDIDEYFHREVLPHVPDAWMDRNKDKVGYEINFNRYFYQYTPPRPLEEIDADLKKAEEQIVRLLKEVTA